MCIREKVSIVYGRKNEMVILCSINNRFMSIIVMISIIFRLACDQNGPALSCSSLQLWRRWFMAVIPHITIRKIWSCWMLKIIHSGYYWMMVDREAGVVTEWCHPSLPWVSSAYLAFTSSPHHHLHSIIITISSQHCLSPLTLPSCPSIITIRRN